MAPVLDFFGAELDDPVVVALGDEVLVAVLGAVAVRGAVPVDGRAAMLAFQYEFKGDGGE